jgi:phosphatidate cytidylyltransferase
MLGAFILIWSADIGAYFAGRKWGKNKLASSISPGKTLEGVLGGLVLALITSFIFMYTTPAYSLVSVYGNIALILAIIVLVIISVAGDLFESAMKRQSGVKDSGNILPGHGGILDRIDSLISVAPVFVALLLWFKVAA